MGKFSFYLGAAVAGWLLAILVIAAELFAPLKDTLKAIFGHHWVGKAVIVAIAFIVFGFLLARRESASSEKIAWYSVLGSLAVILLFYVAEFFV